MTHLHSALDRAGGQASPGSSERAAPPPGVTRGQVEHRDAMKS